MASPSLRRRLRIRGGSVEDPPGKEGAGHLLANMLDEGAGALDADGFKGKLEAVGSELSFSVSQLVFSGGMLSLTKHLDRTAELLRLALQEPRLTEEDFQRARQQEAAGLAFESRNPQRLAIREFYARAFAGHPYARPAKGSEKTLGKLTADDIRAQRARLISRTGLHVVIVGAIDAAGAAALTDKIFAALPERPEPATPPPVTLKPFEKTIPALPGQELETAVFAIPLPGLSDPDFFTAIALNQIMGSGNFDARLAQELRVKRGLTYSASSQIIADRVTSMALGVISTQPGKMGEAIEVMKATFSEFQAKGPEPRELQNAKSGVNGAYLLALDSSAKLANNLIGLWIDGLGPDYAERRKRGIDAVGETEARRAAKAIYDPRALSLLIMKPGAK
ncbi:MAG: insulinase family protein [Rhodomicrobium sp.]|nr:insulinase family protein [Rhodomicrobium sp.]